MVFDLKFFSGAILFLTMIYIFLELTIFFTPCLISNHQRLRLKIVIMVKALIIILQIQSVKNKHVYIYIFLMV